MPDLAAIRARLDADPETLGPPFELLPVTEKDIRALLAIAEAAQQLRDQHTPDPRDTSGVGYRDDGDYGPVDPCCRVCGTPDEYAVLWPCPTYALLDVALRQLAKEPTDD